MTPERRKERRLALQPHKRPVRRRIYNACMITPERPAMCAACLAGTHSAGGCIGCGCVCEQLREEGLLTAPR
jgi:hypothetical protein